MRHLACDGPAKLNGRYIDPATAAANGYTLEEWPTGEKVYMHSYGRQQPDLDTEA